MAEQRQPFRFRLPWLPVAAPRPSPMKTLATAQQAPMQSATAVPFLRPSYRPPGIVLVQPPPPPPPLPPKDQEQESPRAESQVQEPPSGTARSPPFSVARSPLFSAARSPPFSPARSPPFSPARSPATSQPGSPVRTYQFRAASQPSSPEPPTYTVASGPALFQMRSEEQPQTKAEIPTGTQEQPQTVGVAVGVAEIKARAPPQAFIDDRKPIKESEKTGQGKDTSVTETTFSGVQKEEILERREILSTSGFGGKQSKMVFSTHAKEQIPVSEPHTKPATLTGGRVPLHKEIREDITKLVQKLTTGHPKQRTKDEKPISITSLLGENRGASMHFLPESVKKDESLLIRREYKANTDEDSIETITEGEGSSRADSVTKEVQENKAYINSNVQSINNSIFLDASMTERNAGVELGFSCPPLAPANIGHKGESVEAHRAEFSVTPSQKLTYDPSIKRRCLRGLFLESSDSDPDNPEKPRRHGCRYGCGEKNEGNNTDAP